MKMMQPNELKNCWLHVSSTNPAKQLSLVLDVSRFDTSLQWEPQVGNASS